ncbi:MAG: hypothetical protein HKP58_11960 [Desulfatitalea sp.]|nr:hypothetical protein [Desulfatitalea sp.]NNK01117.1 hypothetical protein [Desulfatitalea sp.]
MKSLKAALWVAAIGCLSSVPFIILPWSVVERIALWFGIGAIPNDLLIIYLLRVSCGVYGMIGVYFIILAKNPLGYGPMLDLGAYGLIIFGLLSLFVGWRLEMPLKIFSGDALSGLILGIIIIALSSKAKRTLNPNVS